MMSEHHETPQTKKSPGGQLRKHYFMEQYVIIAPRRAARPETTSIVATHHEALGSPDIVTERAIDELCDSDGNWLVKVIANKFPALELTNPEAFGKQEVIIDTPKHGVEFSELSIEQIERVLAMYKRRLDVLSAIPGIRYVSVFKNDGPKAGASIAHAHSQAVALPLVPPAVETEAEAAAHYTTQHGRTPYRDIMTWEHKQHERVAHEDDHLMALCPYASQNPYELWLLPQKQHADLRDLNDSELHSFAVILKKACAFLDSKNISFNFFVQNALMPDYQTFMIKIVPRKTVWAGLELSTDVIINPVAPEVAAKEYRRVLA